MLLYWGYFREQSFGSSLGICFAILGSIGEGSFAPSIGMMLDVLELLRKSLLLPSLGILDTPSSSQTLLFSHSLPFSHHPFQWHPRPRNPPTSYLLMLSISLARVKPRGWWDLHHWHTSQRITFPWVNL